MYHRPSAGALTLTHLFSGGAAEGEMDGERNKNAFGCQCENISLQLFNPQLDMMTVIKQDTVKNCTQRTEGGRRTILSLIHHHQHQ